MYSPLHCMAFWLLTADNDTKEVVRVRPFFVYFIFPMQISDIKGVVHVLHFQILNPDLSGMSTP